MSMFNYQCDENYQKIKGVSQNYPQLTTFEKEWLFFDRYGYFPGQPVELEYQTVQTNDHASVLNAIPYNYKRASLKGQTLVNIIDKPCNVSPENNRHRAKEFTFKFIKTNTDYFIVYDVTTDLSPIAMGFLKDDGNWSKNIEKISTNKGILKINSGDYPNYFRIVGANNSSSLIVNSIIIIEYQEGMENWDIPYFEGMQSVKMPVLTINRKNMFDKSTITEGVGFSGNQIVEKENTFISDFIKVRPNTSYTMSGKTDGNRVHIFDKNKNLIYYPKADNNVIKTPNDDKIYYMKINGPIEEADTCQLEEGTKATPYEPYQSNILTVNEEVELRGIGEVQDELDLLTGELTQRVEEFIIDKNSNIAKYQDVEGFNTTGYYTNLSSNFVQNTGDFICKSIPKTGAIKIQPNMAPVDEEGIAINGGYIKFRVSNEKGTDVEDLKKYLEINPIKLIIPLVEKSVKKVDLTSLLDKPVEGTNIYQVSSDTINPTFVAEVPIVSEGEQTLAEINQATYQNL